VLDRVHRRQSRRFQLLSGRAWRANGRVVYLEKLEPMHQRIALLTSVGQTMPAHSTALRKAILSTMPQPQQAWHLYHLVFEPKTEATITDRGDYLAELTVT
jgi:DNA-binding IclR family transcriptional regulator